MLRDEDEERALAALRWVMRQTCRPDQVEQLISALDHNVVVEFDITPNEERMYSTLANPLKSDSLVSAYFDISFPDDPTQTLFVRIARADL